jgi:hypothetical protein
MSEIKVWTYKTQTGFLRFLFVGNGEDDGEADIFSLFSLSSMLEGGIRKIDIDEGRERVDSWLIMSCQIRITPLFTPHLGTT